jgi:predicted ester cyclase
MADNKDAIRRLFEEVINQGNIGVIDELLHPEFETVTQMGTMDLAGFKEFVAGWRAGFSDLHAEITDIIAEGDTVAWAIQAAGTNDGPFMGAPATGRSVDFYSLNLATFRDGKGYRHRVVMDLATMMQQLGMAGGPPS